MKKFAAKIFALIDGATLRERLLLFVAVTVVLAAVTDALVLSPVAERERKLRAAIAGYESELNTIENYIRTTVNARGVDPDVAARARQQDLVHELARLDARIVREQERFTSPERMRDVLGETLRASAGARLVQLKSLPIETLAEVIPGGQSQASVERTRIFRHGFELRVTGTYAELHAYLRRLEKHTRIYWGKAVFAVDGYPRSTLTLTVYTLSLDRTWIQV